MKPIIFSFILFTITYSAFSNHNYPLKSKSENTFKITQYEIEIPSIFDKYTMGFSAGLGSGITLKGIKSDGTIELYSINDRGPNYSILTTDDAYNTVIFPRPDYSPFIGVIRIIPKQAATLTQVISLKMDGKKITGLPNPDSKIARKPSIPTDINLKLLSPDPNGFDTESIDIDGEGNFWMGDEYRPALIKAQSNGEITEILTPGNGLPEIFKNGPINRGFEGLAIAPNGKIYAAMESILDFGGKTKYTANFIRIIELDPKTKKTRTFAYPYDKEAYLHPLFAKIGDMAAIDDTHFLLIEQGYTSSGKMRNIIYMIDISEATDISYVDSANNLPLEYAYLNELQEIQFVKKSLILNAQEVGWTHEKLEGIAIINDQTIAITNDNDFGFSISINGIDSEEVIGYSVDYDTQSLLRYGKETEDKIELNIDRKAPTNLWVIEFQKNLLDFVEL